MKIAVAASGDNLEAPADPRFGRCNYFVIVDSDTMEFQALDNTAAAQGSGAGIAAAQLVANSGAEAVIAGNYGPNAFQALSAGGLQLYSGATGTVRQVVEAFNAGQLQPAGGANVQAKFGMGAGTGVGGGAGMGGGMGGGRGMGGGMGRGMGMGGGAMGGGIGAQSQQLPVPPQMGMGGGVGASGQQPPVPPQMAMPPQWGPPMWGPQEEPSPERQIQMLRAQAQMVQAELDWINDQIKALEEAQE